MSEVTEILEKAKALIEDEKHWLKFRLEDGEGAYCLSGALLHTFNEDGEGSYTHFDKAVDHIYYYMNGFLSMPDFNDAPKTTHADVMSVLDRAIKRSKVNHVASF